MAIQLLNLALDVDQLKYDVYHLLDSFVNSPEIVLVDVYRGLIKARHDALHYFVHRSMGIDWTAEAKIDDYFPGLLPLEYKNKTPDTCFERNGFWWIIDYSISVDIHRSYDYKLSKYGPIVKLLGEHGIQACFIHVNVQANYSNLEFELEKLNSLRTHDFEFADFLEICNTLNDHKITVGKRINPETLELVKAEFGADDDELMETNVGTYADLDIDLGGFEKYNSKFNHLDKIVETVGKTCVQDLESELFNILEDPSDPIHQKYRDKKLTTKQFEDAFNTIIDHNVNAPKIDARPSHHMLVPLPLDINHSGQKLNEQESVYNFAKEFTLFYNQNKNKCTHHRLAFIGCVFHSLVECLDGDDGETYRSIYDGRDSRYSKEFDEFKELKKARQYTNLFQTSIRNSGPETKKLAKQIRNNGVLPMKLPMIKLPQRLLNDYEIPVDKNNMSECWGYYKQSQIIIDSNKGIKTFPDYLFKKKLLKKDPAEMSSYIVGDKKIRMSKNKQPQLVKVALEKAGIKADVETKSRAPCQPRGTIPMEQRLMMDDLIAYLSKSEQDHKEYKIYDFLSHKRSKWDSPVAARLKEESIFDYKLYLKPIMKTNAYKYSHYMHLAYNQLFHVNELKSDNETMHVFNLGIDNFCCIVGLTRVEREGKPFMCIIKTPNPDLYTSFWGKLNKIQIPGTNDYYVYTNWRRLDDNKVTYLRDVHFSVLSSTMNSAMSNPMALKYTTGNRIGELYSLRTLVALSSNQKTSELLLDTRYAYMSSISWYTDLGKLLVEKFGYQFNTVIEAWIIWKLITRLKEINHAAKNGGIANYRLNIDLHTKDIQSIGGHINLPSLWLDQTLTDITELLDEAFLYVHTIKEPANIFHEQIKAVQTIIKFQGEYDSLPDYIKSGSVDNKSRLREFLLRKGYVGCCVPIIVASVTQNIEQENPNFKQYVHEIASESVGELLSTKAVIAEHKREVVTDKKLSNREIKKRVKREKDVLGLKTEQEIKQLTQTRLKVSSRFYNDYKPRQKVWETIMEYLETDPQMERTVHLANYFLKNPMVQADICIKSQYGGKREFYVINITAKALARLTENFFRMLSQNSDHEAISIPGDRKVLRMQRMLDIVHTIHKTECHEIIYTNGDCTKWSAAETMQSFLAMTFALKDKLPIGLYNVLLATYNSWSDKKIQLPMDIYNKVLPSEDHNTNYLKELKERNTPQITSTQNFLQGMFNYSSSYKAVCCNNYTYNLWKKFYPTSDLKIEHLEHSDDYVTVCLYSDILEFEKYRLLNKIVMRLHGYNDSERKTCSQPYIMEFVSQMSHNGVMLYPQIKKAKEINLSLPCTGYSKDMEAAMSRVGECARVGCNLSFLYFFQRLHTYVVAEAYSVLPGMRNNMNRTVKELFGTPVELFGVPDPHPIFSLYCRGDINNYRLYTYGGPVVKDAIRKLYKKSLYVSSVEGVAVEKEDDRYCLATPRFLYDMGNKTLAKLKKNIGIQIEEVKGFWEEHPVYKLLKPKTNKNLLTWVKSMFYNRTFMEAYSTTTRAKMTLRIPRYVGRKMIVEAVELEKHYEKQHKWGTKILTMQEYYDRITKQMAEVNLDWSDNDEIHLSRIITKCDPTASQIYSILNTLTITITDMTRKQTIQVSSPHPRRTTTLSLVNEPATLLQYILDRDCFISDKRRVRSRGSLEKDVLLIQNKYGLELQNTKNTMALLSVYNDLMITKQPQNVLYTYDRHSVTLQDFIVSTFRNNYHPGYVCKVTNTNVGNIIDPTTLKTLFLKQHRHTKDYHRQCIDNICLLHVFLTQTQGMSKQNAMRVLDSLKFEMPGGDMLGYIQILKTITENYMLLNDFTLTERKIIAYLCAYYLNDYDHLETLVNNHYSFSYRYNQKAFKRGGVYVGETIVTFNHFNTVVKTYHDERYGDPIIVMQKHYPTASPALYNIALRLTDCISQTKYEEDPTVDRRRLLSGMEIQDKISNLRPTNITHVVKPGSNDYDTYTKITKIKAHEFYYPIFITSAVLQRTGKHHFSKQRAHPHLDNDNLVVTLGKAKLYVLPYWRCNQYNNMITTLADINGLPFQEILMERRIEYYLLSINKLRNTVETTPTHDLTRVLERLKKHIKCQKIYDFKFGDILRGASPYVQWLNADGKERIDGNFVVSVLREPIEPISDEETTIDIPHIYNPMPASPEQPKGKDPEDTPGVFTDQGYMGSVSNVGFLMDMDFDDAGMWEEETNLIESNDIPKPAKFVPDDDDYQYVDQPEENTFTLDLGDEGVYTDGTIIDDVNDALSEGLNYHLKEYIGEDVYHREIHGRIMDDKFLVEPRTKKRVQKTWKKKEYDYYSQMGSNYMVLRLKKIPDLFILLYMHSKRIPLGYDIMNLYSLKQNLQHQIDLLNYNTNKAELPIDDQLMVWFYLEKLLCRTYLVDNLTHKQSVGFAYDLNHNLHLGVWTNSFDKYTKDQKKDLLNRGKILAIDGNHLLIRTSLDRFEKQVSAGLATGVLTYQPTLLSLKYDKQMEELMLRINGACNNDLLDMLDFE